MIVTHKNQLANGLRVVVVEMPHLHSAEIAVYIKAGGRDDPPDREGLAHFTEHMLFRGTAEYPTTLELENAFEAIGGSVNAATDAETTCFYSRVYPGRVTEGIRIFSSMLLHPTLPGIEIEKRIVGEEAREDINEKGEEINADNLASKLLWPGHPLGAPIVGTLETISGFTEVDIRRYLSRFYTPDNALLVVSGNVSVETVFAAAEEVFTDWRGSVCRTCNPASAAQTGCQSLFVADADSQVTLQVAFRAFAVADERIMATRFIRRILCGGGSSRLHMNLRERLGIVYSVDASISAFAETGCFAIELATAPNNLCLAVAEVLAETSRLAVELVPDQELERVREAYFYELEFSRDSTYEMQARFGWGELLHVAKEIEADRQEAAAVSKESLLAVARMLFAPDSLNLVAVGPVRAGVKRKLAGILERYEEDFPRSRQGNQ